MGRLVGLAGHVRGEVGESEERIITINVTRQFPLVLVRPCIPYFCFLHG